MLFFENCLNNYIRYFFDYILKFSTAIYRGKDGDKNDVYDLGVILLEIIVGRPITSKNDVVVARDLVSVLLATLFNIFFCQNPFLIWAMVNFLDMALTNRANIC